MEQSVPWKRDAEPSGFSPLTEDLKVDVAIIGGGITGITTGYLLAKAGKKVAVLEARSVGGGTTGYSTGNLYATIDEMLHKIESKFDTKTMQEVAVSRTQAICQIEANIRELGIECNYHKRSWFLFSESEEDDATVEKEYHACVSAGLDAHLMKKDFLPFHTSSALRVDHQAQFNPVQYMRAFAKKTAEAGCRIFEHSKVTEIEEGHDNILTIEGGHKVTASHVVHATHTTKGIMMIQTFLGPYREYAMAVKLRSGTYPEGIFWAFNKPHHHSIRSYTDDKGEQYLFILGEPHKVGQKENNEECFQKIEQYIRERFDVESVAYRWGAQHYKSADGLPYIGRKFAGSQTYIATGFSTDGLVYGTLSAMIISDLILERKNQWAEMYDPGRHTPLKSAERFTKENVNVAIQYLKNIVFSPEAENLASIPNEEAKTIEIDGNKYGAYRDKLGIIHVVSIVCTHMRCVLNWNQGEKSWDCPCHGSRFDYEGKVIEGCAINDLPTYSEQARKALEGDS